MKTKTNPSVVLMVSVSGILFTGVLYFILTRLPVLWVALIAVVFLLLVPAAFFLGFWMGAVEVKGVLRGLDVGMEKYFNFREKTAPQVQPPVVVMQPPRNPEITQRLGAGRDEWTEY